MTCNCDRYCLLNGCDCDCHDYVTDDADAPGGAA